MSWRTKSIIGTAISMALGGAALAQQAGQSDQQSGRYESFQSSERGQRATQEWDRLDQDRNQRLDQREAEADAELIAAWAEVDVSRDGMVDATEYYLFAAQREIGDLQARSGSGQPQARSEQRQASQQHARSSAQQQAGQAHQSQQEQQQTQSEARIQAEALVRQAQQLAEAARRQITQAEQLALQAEQQAQQAAQQLAMQQQQDAQRQAQQDSGQREQDTQLSQADEESEREAQQSFERDEELEADSETSRQDRRLQ